MVLRCARDTGSIRSESALIAIRSKRRDVDGLRLAGHHVSEQPAGHRAEREALVAVSEIHPESAMVPSRPKHRQHVGRAWTGAVPWVGFDVLPELEQLAGRGFGPRKLDRRGS